MKETSKIDLLRIKCLTFTEFFLRKNIYDEDVFNKIIDAIEQAHKEKKTRVLDALNKDNFYMIREAMPTAYLLELKKIWFEKVGQEFDDFQILIDKKINKIIKKGIKSLDDYEIVHNEVEIIWDDAIQKEKFEVLNNLLSDWHTKHP